MINIPNTITTLRLLIMYYFIHFKNNKIKAYLFLGIFWALDMIDGKVARYLKQVTKFGGFYDYLVDYIMYLYLLCNLHISLKNKYRIIISGIHIFIAFIQCIYTLFNSHKARHTTHSNKIVQLYQKNNFRNLFASILIVNSSVVPFILFTNYNIFVDVLFLLGEFINFYILIIRAIEIYNSLK